MALNCSHIKTEFFGVPKSVSVAMFLTSQGWMTTNVHECEVLLPTVVPLVSLLTFETDSWVIVIVHFSKLSTIWFAFFSNQKHIPLKKKHKNPLKNYPSTNNGEVKKKPPKPEIPGQVPLSDPPFQRVSSAFRAFLDDLLALDPKQRPKAQKVPTPKSTEKGGSHGLKVVVVSTPFFQRWRK